MPLAVSRIHAQEHLGPVGRVDPARLRPDRHERLAGVVFAGEQRADLELGDCLRKVVELLHCLSDRSLIALVLGELEENRQVAQAPAQRLELAHLALHE
ncbi:unannotated protein [freshwater metagenome]|uniref:Unannotated protein n=1 Tax=freshwater metagenome TaxID=449393 RepID=A0A6J7PJW1_9ZZZZ